MFSLPDLLGPQQGSEAVDQISQTVGADQSMVNSAIQMALPILITGLQRNASTPTGAESLNTALEQDHSGGGILGNLGGLTDMIFGGGQATPAPPPQADAGGILGHILGNKQGQVAEEVSNRTGLNMGQVAQILMFLAPIVMSYLGQPKTGTGRRPRRAWRTVGRTAWWRCSSAGRTAVVREPDDGYGIADP